MTKYEENIYAITTKNQENATKTLKAVMEMVRRHMMMPSKLACSMKVNLIHNMLIFSWKYLLPAHFLWKTLAGAQNVASLPSPFLPTSEGLIQVFYLQLFIYLCIFICVKTFVFLFCLVFVLFSWQGLTPNNRNKYSIKSGPAVTIFCLNILI